MDKILDIKARQVLDSRGNPTLEVDVITEHSLGSAMVPSGASTGKREALELRDGSNHYLGKSVLKAVRNVNTKIKKALVGFNVLDQAGVDGLLIDLDGTNNKSKLGANAILGVSLAVSRAAAAYYDEPLFSYISRITGRKPLLPIPFANVINGGKHADGNLEFQEFMIVPIGAKSFSEAVMMVSETYHILKGIIKDKYGSSAVHLGDEGGFAPPIDSVEEALDLLVEAVNKAGYKGRIKFALDAAASEFYYPHHKLYLKKGFSPEELLDYYLFLIKKYPIVSLEDPFDQDDFLSFHEITKRTKRKKHFQIVGDDLLVSNPKIVMRAVEDHWCNSLLLKVNQIGTLTEALRSANIAFSAGWSVMVSHRSGETEDPFIADLAVGLGTGMIKLGAPARGERTAKYNQLLRIEEVLGRKARYASFK